MTLRDLLDRAQLRVQQVLGDAATSPLEKSVAIAERALHFGGLDGALGVDLNHVLELTTAPRPFRGLRDLVVRTTTPEDGPQVMRIGELTPAFLAKRVERRDRCWVGESQGALLAMVWLHRGPSPFCEDADRLACFSVGNDTLWSYHAVAVPEARQSGVFVKVFQTALVDALQQPGITRVRCRIKYSNVASLKLHEALGFRRLGVLQSARMPLGRVLRWRGAEPWTRIISTGDAIEVGFRS